MSNRLLVSAALAAVSAAIFSSPAPAQSVTTQQVGSHARVTPAPWRLPPPRGVYCSCPPTTSMSDSVLPEVAAQPFVEGILVRVGWDEVEVTRGSYDFTLVSNQLTLAEQYGKKVALALVQGTHTPSWLATEGAQMVTYDFMGQSRTIAAAWDPIYQSIWEDTVFALGAAFGHDTRISLVHVCNATHNGFEMQLPLGAQSTFVAAGYTEQGFISSWERLIDGYAMAFPIHPIDVEVHPVFGSDVVAQDVTSYGLLKLGPGYGAFGAWWTYDNATQVYPGMFSILSLTAPRSFAMVQLAGSWVTTPERFDHDLREYMESVTLAQLSGVRYVEVWNADILEPTLQPFLASVNDAMTQ